MKENNEKKNQNIIQTIVYCADNNPRVSQAHQHFIEKYLKPDPIKISILGGTFFLGVCINTSPYFVSLQKNVLLQNMEIAYEKGCREFYLMTHKKCWVYTNSFPNETPENLIKDQEEDLRFAKTMLLQKFNDITVKCYYADINEEIEEPTFISVI